MSAIFIVVKPAVVLAVMQLQAPCWRDREVAPEVKAEQYAWIAEAIAHASPTPQRAAYLIALGYSESGWCLDVHAGKRRTGYADGLWQLEGHDKRDRGPLQGLTREATINAARVASETIARTWQCGPSVAGRITAYAGRPCTDAVAGWPTLDARVSRFFWASFQLNKFARVSHTLPKFNFGGRG